MSKYLNLQLITFWFPPISAKCSNSPENIFNVWLKLFNCCSNFESTHFPIVKRLLIKIFGASWFTKWLIMQILLHTAIVEPYYIGHSQRTTSFLLMASLKKEMNAGIRTKHAFGLHLARWKQILEGKWILFDLIDFAASQSSVWIPISSSSCFYVDLKCPSWEPWLLSSIRLRL